MRMAPCPKCGGHNVNNFKKGRIWGSKCYDKECGYTLISDDFISRKIARYAWNRDYEQKTGNTLPDEMCGRQNGAFTKKERLAGYTEDNINGNAETYWENEKRRKMVKAKRREQRAYARKQARLQEQQVKEENE